MRTIVKMDKKGRLYAPNKMRKVMKIGSRQLMYAEVKGGELIT